MVKRSTHVHLLALVATLWPSARCDRVARHSVSKHDVSSDSLVEAASESTVSGNRRRRRRSCNEGDWTAKKGETLKCKSSGPDACSPPEAYTIIRWEGENTTLGTYSDWKDARDVYDGASGAQFKVRLNEAQEPTDVGDNCGNREEYQAWAMEQLTRVEECKYPWGGWIQELAVLNATATYRKTIKTEIGTSWSKTDTETVSVSTSTKIGLGPFKSSSKFKYAAQSASTSTWEKKDTVTESWEIKRGQSTVVWRYKFKAKCFNAVGQFLDEATFASNIKVMTSDLREPDCDPNDPGSCDFA